MNWWNIIVGCILTMFIAVFMERLFHAVNRRQRASSNRYAMLGQALRDQQQLPKEILERPSISNELKKFIFLLSKSADSRAASLQFAAWLDRGEPRPLELPSANRLIQEWERIKKADPAAANDILAFANRTSVIMLLLWNETLRSLGWLYLDMTAEGPLHFLALIEEATARTSEGPRPMESFTTAVNVR